MPIWKGVCVTNQSKLLIDPELHLTPVGARIPLKLPTLGMATRPFCSLGERPRTLWFPSPHREAWWLDLVAFLHLQVKCTFDLAARRGWGVHRFLPGWQCVCVNTCVRSLGEAASRRKSSTSCQPVKATFDDVQQFASLNCARRFAEVSSNNQSHLSFGRGATFETIICLTAAQDAYLPMREIEAFMMSRQSV